MGRHGARRGAVHRGQGAAVQVEAGEGGEHLVRAREQGHVRVRGEHVGERLAVPVPQQEGAGRVPGGQGPSHHLGGLGEEDAVLGVHAAATDAIVQALGKVGEASGAIEAATSGLGDEADGEVAALEALAGNFTTLDASTSALRETENSTRHAVESIDELLGAFDGQWPSDGPCNARPSDGSRNDDI